MPAIDLVPLTCSALEDAAREVSNAMANGPVLVCCALGYSRSAATVANRM